MHVCNTDWYQQIWKATLDVNLHVITAVFIQEIFTFSVGLMFILWALRRSEGRPATTLGGTSCRHVRRDVLPPRSSWLWMPSYEPTDWLATKPMQQLGNAVPCRNVKPQNTFSIWSILTLQYTWTHVLIRPAEGTAVFASNHFTPFVERDVSELTALFCHTTCCQLISRYVTTA
jgi:hypothetical protein